MTNELTDNSVPAIASPFRFQWEEAQQAYVILYPEGMVKLNPSAGEILNLCDDERTVAQIIETLEEKFSVADLAGDVRSFLDVAREQGWIRTR